MSLHCIDVNCRLTHFSMHQCINLTLWSACMNRHQTSHSKRATDPPCASQENKHLLFTLILKWIYQSLNIYIYAFSRRFYPKRLTLHSSYSFTFDQLLSVRIRQRAQREPDQQTNGKKEATSSFHACHSSPCKLNGCSCFCLDSCVWRCAFRQLQGEDKTPYSAGTGGEVREGSEEPLHSPKWACFTLIPQLFGKIM